jgi:hypothetical protein
MNTYATGNKMQSLISTLINFPIKNNPANSLFIQKSFFVPIEERQR